MNREGRGNEEMKKSAMQGLGLKRRRRRRRRRRICHICVCLLSTCDMQMQVGGVVVLWRLKVLGKKAFSSTSWSRSRRVLQCFNDGYPFTTTNSPPLSAPPILGLDDLPDIWTPSPATINHRSPLLPTNHGNEHTATMIDGKSIAEEIRSKITREVTRMKNIIGRVPGLAVVLVGQRRDSQTYVRNKIKACEEAGITSLMAELPDDCAEDEVINVVTCFNENPSVHGILVQLPLPQHMNEEKILNVVSLEKDVDGFHPLNMGHLAMRGRVPLFIPCTPKACIELLLRSGMDIMGKKAVVIGRSNIVGLPTSLLLQRHHATVTIVHAFTKNPGEITREADIVVSATGVANLVRGNWLKQGAVVIDVGTNPVEDPNSEHGYRLTGDVCYEEAMRVASAITPVPGGVGPMTIAMLLCNTLHAAKRAYGLT